MNALPEEVGAGGLEHFVVRIRLGKEKNALVKGRWFGVGGFT